MKPHIEQLKASIAKIGNDPDGSKLAGAVVKAIHETKQARPASPPPARPGRLKKIVNADSSLRKLVLD
jgi:hypothetical protein